MGSASQKGLEIYAREAVLANARGLIPLLRARAESAESLRRVPPETVRDLKEAKLFRVLQPARFGGGEQDYGLLLEMLYLLAKGCISTAWVGFNVASHNWMLAMWPDEVQRSVWNEDPEAMICSSLVFPVGKAVAVAGGFRVSGKWPFSSGVDIAHHVMLGATLPSKDPGQAPRRIVALASLKDVKVIDTWHVAGLCGTGSKNLEVDDLFVPDAWVVEAERLSDGTAPGLESNRAAVYRLPVIGVFPHLVSAVVLGNAAGAYEDFLDAAAKKRTMYARLEPKQLVGIQMRVAEAGALIEAGRTLMLADVREATDIAARGEQASEEQKLRWRRNATYAAGFGTKAVDLLFAGSGGSGIYLSNPIQRRFRDAHAAINHIQTSWDVNGADYGRYILSA